MDVNLEDFVNINCCNQLGCKLEIIELVTQLETLVEEAYEEGRIDGAHTGCNLWKESDTKEKLNKLLIVTGKPAQ